MSTAMPARRSEAAPPDDRPMVLVYVADGLLLGAFMMSVGVFAPLLYSPRSPIASVVPGEPWRGVLMGVVMGLTAIGLIYSPVGAFSGALLNPAATVAFVKLGKLRLRDAVGYILAQCLGGVAGCIAIGALVGPAFTDPPISYAPTVPGRFGAWPAFVAEFLMAAVMMMVVLRASNSKRLAPHAGLLAGALIAIFITFFAPVSGFSINPARSLASAVASGVFTGVWIYLIAPVAGMLIGAHAHTAWCRRSVHCCKMNHSVGYCPHCGCDGPIDFDAHPETNA